MLEMSLSDMLRANWRVALRIRGRTCAATLMVFLMHSAHANLCGAVTNAYGPYDYRSDRGPTLEIVEINHFTPSVEQLIRGKSSTLGGDLDYTLRAFPNHHRALIALAKLGDRQKTDQVDGTKWTVECYFDRAIRFRPDDNTVRMLYATFLHKKQRKAEALNQLREVRQRAGENPFTIYNMGLVYMDMGEAELALERAHAAMALGFTRMDLKERLVAAGRWAEPAAATAAAASASSAASPR